MSNIPIETKYHEEHFSGLYTAMLCILAWAGCSRYGGGPCTLASKDGVVGGYRMPTSGSDMGICNGDITWHSPHAFYRCNGIICDILPRGIGSLIWAI